MKTSSPSGARVARGLLAAVSAAAMLAGCTFEADPPSGAAAYPTEIESAQIRATSDFEKRVLADGDIDAGEYKEAMDLFYECLRSRDLQVETQVSPAGLQTFSLTGADVDASVADCSEGTTRIIEPLYTMLVSNPQNRDVYALMAECLVAVGFVDAPFSRDDFIREFDTREFTERVMDDPKGSACINNPNHHNVSASR